MNRYNPFKNIFEDCPPESPHQLYVNAALHAVGQAHGAFMNDLSEEVSQLVINAATTAAYAALEAAHVGDEWIDIVKPTTTHSVFTESVINGPVDVFMAMAWQFQADHYPQLLDDRFSEEYHGMVIDAVDAMLRLALTAAGADGAWNRLYEQTLAKIQG